MILNNPDEQAARARRDEQLDPQDPQRMARARDLERRTGVYRFPALSELADEDWSEVDPKLAEQLRELFEAWPGHADPQGLLNRLQRLLLQERAGPGKGRLLSLKALLGLLERPGEHRIIVLEACFKLVFGSFEAHFGDRLHSLPPKPAGPDHTSYDLLCEHQSLFVELALRGEPALRFRANEALALLPDKESVALQHYQSSLEGEISDFERANLLASLAVLALNGPAAEDVLARLQSIHEPEDLPLRFALAFAQTLLARSLHRPHTELLVTGLLLEKPWTDPKLGEFRWTRFASQLLRHYRPSFGIDVLELFAQASAPPADDQQWGRALHHLERLAGELGYSEPSPCCLGLNDADRQSLLDQLNAFLPAVSFQSANIKELSYAVVVIRCLLLIGRSGPLGMTEPGQRALERFVKEVRNRHLLIPRLLSLHDDFDLAVPPDLLSQPDIWRFGGV